MLVTKKSLENELQKELLDFKANKEGQREKKRVYLEEKIRDLKRERRGIIQRINKIEKDSENIKVLIEFIQKFDNIFPEDIYGHPKVYFDQENKFLILSEKNVTLIQYL